jgi:hypothetical protein
MSYFLSKVSVNSAPASSGPGSADVSDDGHDAAPASSGPGSADVSDDGHDDGHDEGDGDGILSLLILNDMGSKL